MDEQDDLPLPAPEEGPPPNLAVRRLPVPVEAPALTRSVLFRPNSRRDPISAPTEGEYANRIKQRTTYINEFLRRISENPAYQSFGGRFKVGGEPSQSDGRSTQETFYQRISKPDPGLFHIDLIVEVYAEAVAITFQAHRNERQFYKLSSEPNAITLADSAHSRVCAGLQLLIDESAQSIQHDLATMSFTQIDAIQELLYEKFWADIDNTLKDAWRIIGYGEANARYQVIAEFRGVCLTTMPLPLLITRAERRTKIQEYYALDSITNPRSNLLRDGKISPEALSFINRRRGYFARFLGYSSAVAEINRPPEGANSVMCGMLGGLAVYAAVFRAEETQPALPRPNYVKYKLVFSAASSNQLGRLVLRIHRSGISRVCALLDSRQIDNCSHEIRRIGLTIGGSSHASSVLPPEARDVRRKRIQAAQARLRAALNACRGGLRFRIAQSRYYSSRLSHTIKDLRIVRIGGWQTYDDFLKRHLFGQLEKIDRLGHRLDDLSRRIDQEQAELLSEDLISLNESTATHTRAMLDASEKVATATREISIANRELVDLQFTAEVFAFIAGGYYFPGIIVAALDLHEPWKQRAYGAVAVTLTIAFLLRNRPRISHMVKSAVSWLQKSAIEFMRNKGHKDN